MGVCYLADMAADAHTAIVLGASGSVGEWTCRALAAHPKFDHVVTINRGRELEWLSELDVSTKFTQVVVTSEEMTDPSKLREATAKACQDHCATHAFSAFGIGSNTSSITKELWTLKATGYRLLISSALYH